MIRHRSTSSSITAVPAHITVSAPPQYSFSIQILFIVIPKNSAHRFIPLPKQFKERVTWKLVTTGCNWIFGLSIINRRPHYCADKGYHFGIILMKQVLGQSSTTCLPIIRPVPRNMATIGVCPAWARLICLEPTERISTLLKMVLFARKMRAEASAP